MGYQWDPMGDEWNIIGIFHGIYLLVICCIANWKINSEIYELNGPWLPPAGGMFWALNLISDFRQSKGVGSSQLVTVNNMR